MLKELDKKTKLKPAKDPQPLMTFNRWFAVQGRQTHHKAGMQAFANTKGKRSVTAWNRLFEGY